MPAISNFTRPFPITLPFDVDGELMSVTFDRNRVTPAWFAQSKAYISDSDPLTTPRSLADIIIVWDVTQEDGTPFPPTAENLAMIPMPVLNLMLNEMLDAAVPSRAEGNASSVPSATPPSASTPPVLTPPNGEVTSTLPVPSASPSLT